MSSCVPDHGPREGLIEDKIVKVSKKPFLPESLMGKVIAITLTVMVLALVVLVVLAPLTKGAAGLVRSHGNSLSKYYPEGSTAITWPLPPRDRDFVTAITGSPDDTRDATAEDLSEKLSIKLYRVRDGKGHLESTDAPESYSKFEYRGRVVAKLSTNRWFPWLDTGAQNPAPNMPKLTEERKTLGGISTRLEKDRIKVFVSSGSPAWRKFDGLKVGDGSKPVVIVLPERCKTVGVVYGSSASAVLVIFTDKGREIARLRGSMPEVQRISAPEGELIAKATLLLEKNSPPAQMGKLTAIRKIE